MSEIEATNVKTIFLNFIIKLDLKIGSFEQKYDLSNFIKYELNPPKEIFHT